MTATLHKYFCRSALLMVSFFLFASQAFAVIAPDVTTLTSISSGLSTPVRLAADSAGGLYVSDPRGGGIVKFASDGSYASTVPTATGISGVAIATNGQILVSQGTSVAVYPASGNTKVREFGTFGKANGIAVTETGEIFVVDSLNNNIQVFNADYSPRNGTANSFGSVGTATGQFRQPTGIAYEKVSDQLAVTDTRNGRIQFFTAAGEYKKSIGSFGAGPLKFTSPQAVSFEYSADQATLKRIYVVDSFQSTIQVIDGTTNEFVRFIGGYGITDGKLITPSDILFDKNNRLVVANGTGKLDLFGISEPSTGPYLQINTIPQATNVATLTISGTTTGTSITINGAAATLSGTNWNGTINLAPGNNTIAVVATDTKGSTTKTASVIVIAVANPVSLTVSPVAAQTAQSVLALSGTVETGAGVTVNGAAATVTGTTWRASVVLSSGANTLRISASKSGMDTSTIDLSVTLDTSLPVFATRLPSTGSVFSTPLQTISGTVSSSNATTVIVTVNGTSQSVTVSDGVFFIPVVLALGSNNISVVAVDTFGATTQAVVSSVVYNPQSQRVTITTPAAAVSGTQTYHLEGTVPVGSRVTVNGTDATVTGTVWSISNVQLSPGINGFEVKALLPSGQSTTAMTSVAYSPGLPSLSITSPAKDSAVATDMNTLTGTASPGATVTARVNGNQVSVLTSVSGAFSVIIPAMTDAGTYSVTVTVTDAASGATSTSTRSIIYDPTPPVIATVSAISPIVVTAPGGILTAKDKNGPVGTVTYPGGVATLDLTGVTYDTATLNIQALSPTGLSSRTGDMNLDGVVDIADALKALRILVGLEPQPSFEQMLHGDVGPIANGEPTTDSRIRMSDVVVIIDKIIGLSSW